MRIIAFLSRKGGVGKTTSVVNLAAALALLERRVLIVDLDSLAAASRTLGLLRPPEESLAAAFVGTKTLAQVIQPTALNHLWLAPSAPDLVAIESFTGVSAEQADENGPLSTLSLAQALQTVDGSFDYVLLDCPGGQLFMEKLALLAADEVIVPTGLSVTDLYGAAPTLELIQLAQSARGDGRPSLLGFLPNEASKGGIPPKFKEALDCYGLPCFTPVRYSSLLATLPGLPRIEQRVIVHYRPSNPAALSYLQVAREIEDGIGAVNVLADHASSGVVPALVREPVE